MADLKRAYRALDPAQPAQNPDHYVPRPGDPMGVLGEELKIRTSPLHVLVGGQRGVGKTTELNRLQVSLNKEGRPHAFFNVNRLTDPATNVFLAGLSRILITELPAQSELAVKARKTSLQPHQVPTSSLELMLDDVIRDIRLRDVHPFTCLLDGFEKYAPSDVADTIRIFGSLPCSFVVVAPLSLLLSPQYASVIADWDRVISIPAITLSNRDGSPNAECALFLRTIIERRAGADAFERPALDLVVQASAGIHRELFTLAQQACLRASVAGRVQVREDDAREAIEDRRQEVSFHLTPQDLDYLLEIHEHHRVTANPLALPLIERNLIVGYHGGWSWFDVHPIVEPLVTAHRRRTP